MIFIFNLLTFAVFLCSLIGGQLSNAESPQKTLFCYHTNWSQFRPGLGKFLPEYIDANMCTHIVYAFANLDNGILVPLIENDEEMYRRITRLKWTNTDLKVLIAVGGWTAGSGKFSDMVHNEQMRRNFVLTSVKYLRKYGFDGLDVDWEYPASYEGSRKTDKKHFSLLLQELHEEFKENSLLLTASVSTSKTTIDNGYEVPALAKYLDYILLMSYDYNGSWNNFTGFNTPLYALDDEMSTMNIDWTVKYYIDKGAPKDKIILGLGMYGRSFALKNKNRNRPGDFAIGPAHAGRYTNESGFLSYYEICDKISRGWAVEWHNDNHVPYAYHENEWVGFDNTQSLREKVNYIKKNGLMGAMIWSLDLDDFNGKFCSKGNYPLTNYVKKLLATEALLSFNDYELNDDFGVNINNAQALRSKYIPALLIGLVFLHII